jgi:aromatic-L-amino-acid decarboxylase
MASTDPSANGASNGHNSTLDQRTIPPMGMTGQQFQEAAISAVNDIEKYYTNLPERTVIPSIAPGYLQKLLPSSAPQRGEQWDAIAKDIDHAWCYPLAESQIHGVLPGE